GSSSPSPIRARRSGRRAAWRRRGTPAPDSDVPRGLRTHSLASVRTLLRSTLPHNPQLRDLNRGLPPLSRVVSDGECQSTCMITALGTSYPFAFSRTWDALPITPRDEHPP